MPYRVLYNNCFGGWHLSREAEDLIEYYCQREGLDSDDDRMHRHDPILLRVYDELGSVAMSGKHCKVACKTIKGNVYKIEEYDGNETVVEPGHDKHCWVTIK